MTTTTINALLASQPSSFDRVLSVVWLFLCTTLVAQKPHLIHVFYAFTSSWLFAGVSLMVLRSHRSRKLVGEHSLQDVRLVQHMVALMALAASLAHSTKSLFQDPPTWSSCYSTLAGYLAFDHWFSALFRLDKPLGRIIQDAVVLTVALILLATTNNHADEHDNRSWCLPDCTVTAYVLYEFTQHVMYLTTVMKPKVCDHQDDRLGTSQTALPDKSLNHPDKMAPDHHTKIDNIWLIHGEAYDLDDYVDRHPGGREAILLGKSRDCTALFDSYHPFTSAHLKVLQKYRVVGCKSHDDPVSERDPFYRVLTTRVAETLRANGIDPIQDRTATSLRSFYYVFIICCVLGSGYAHCKGSILGSFLFAIFGWLLGALGHDAGHFCVSHSPFINDFGVWAMSLLCNPMLWQHQHTYAHHSHTNDFDQDPDLHHFETLLRVHKRFKQKGVHILQKNWLYVMFAYMFVVFGTCFWIPWGMFQDGKSLYGMVSWTDRARPLRYLGFLLHLIAYVGVVMILPYFTHQTWLSAWTAVTIHVSTSGLIFAVFSQINHLNEASLSIEQIKGTSNPPDRRKEILAKSWAARQVETSNNFASQSILWHFLSNGLNYQIEHHLFPGINHCHLHHIAPVVKQTCEEFGIVYKSYENWSEIMQATLIWLKRLATEAEAATPNVVGNLS